jgi:MSHA pilin protein MshC
MTLVVNDNDSSVYVKLGLKVAGFTLIEMVTTIVLVTILFVVVAPRFLGPSQFAAVAARDALIGDLRRLQQSRLAGQNCTFVVTSTSFNLTGTCQGSSAYVLDDVSLNLGGNTDFTVMMDSLGRPIGACTGGCDIGVIGEDNETVRIEAEGYVRGL